MHASKLWVGLGQELHTSCLLCTPQHTTPHHNTSQPFTTHQLGTQTKYAQEEGTQEGNNLACMGLGVWGFWFRVGVWGSGVSRWACRMVWGLWGLGFWGLGVWVPGVRFVGCWGSPLGLAALVCGWPGFGFRQPTHTHTQLQPGRGSGGLGGLPHGLPKHACLRPGNWPHQQRCTLPCMHVPGRCRHAGFHLSQVACMHACTQLGLSKARQGMLACMYVYIHATHTHTATALLHFTWASLSLPW